MLIGVDAGLVNCGICVTSLDDICCPAILDKQFICDASVPLNDRFYAMYNWISGLKAYFEEAKLIVLERQMRAPYKMLNTMIMTLYPLKFVVVHPFTLCSFYKLPRKRKAKKLETIKYVKTKVKLPEHLTKLDDVADAMLLCLYAKDNKMITQQ